MALKILVLGDTHFPFANKQAIRWTFDQADKLGPPTHVIQVGDLYDFFAFGKFPRHKFVDPKKELSDGRNQACEFWGEIKRRWPKAERIQLRGNHDLRAEKRAAERFPELLALLHVVGYDKFWEFPTCDTISNTRQTYKLGGAHFIHGHLSRPGAHIDAVGGNNVVLGHLHRGYVLYKPVGNKIRFELNAGYLGDPKTVAFSYTALAKFANWTLGFGWIDDFGPRFVSK